MHYCAETFANDGTLPSLIMKALKRTMAGEYSRELGVKVLAGQKRPVRWDSNKAVFRAESLADLHGFCPTLECACPISSVRGKLLLRCSLHHERKRQFLAGVELRSGRKNPVVLIILRHCRGGRP